MALFALLLVVLTAHFVAVLDAWFDAVRYPFELDYGEGIVWQQAMLIPGSRMYGNIHDFPYIVFHYPPVYHLAVHAIASLGVDWLIAGRGLSVVAAFATGTLVAALVFHAARTSESRTASMVGASVAGLITFTYVPVVVCASLMRVDMLAVALSFLGVYCAIRSLDRPWLLYPAVVAFVLAVFTKQTAVAAPLATFPVLFLLEPRRVFKAMCCGLVLGVVVLALLTWQTDGGFLRHILLYNINRYSALFAVLNLLQQSNHAIYLVLAIAGVVTCWQAIERTPSAPQTAFFGAGWMRLIRNPTACVPAIFMAYFGITTAMLVTAGKSGATMNYFIEWMCVWSVLIGLLVARTVARWSDRPSGAMCLAALLLMQLAILPAPHRRDWADPAKVPALQALVERVRATSAPVLSDDMVLLIKAGKPVPWEPAIFTELTAVGRWDQNPFVATIKSRQFAFVITSGQPGEKLFDSRHTPEVADAIETAYPRLEQYGGLTVHLPPK
jgi:hypothetical protein